MVQNVKTCERRTTQVLWHYVKFLCGDSDLDTSGNVYKIIMQNMKGVSGGRRREIWDQVRTKVNKDLGNKHNNVTTMIKAALMSKSADEGRAALEYPLCAYNLNLFGLQNGRRTTKTRTPKR